MAPFRVHTVPGSPFARAVLAALEEKRAAYDVLSIKLGTLKQEPHLGRHAFGRMPVLEHGDFVLYETQAILRYVDRVVPDPPLAPAGARQAARMDQVLNITDWYLFQGVANVIVGQRIIMPRLRGATPDLDAIAQAMPKAQVVVAELDRLLGRGPWFGGDVLCLADLHVAAQLDLLALTPEWSVLERNVRGLVDWLARVSDRPSMRATTWDEVARKAQQPV